MDGNSRAYVSKAQDVVATVLAKGSALGQDAVNKAKAFDEKHQLRANASAKVSSFDKRVGLTEKLSVGISAVNEKVKSVDQKLQVSDKTMAAIFAAERKLNDTGSAVKSSRYVTAGAAWFSGAFSKVARVGQVAGSKTKEKFNLAVSNMSSKVSHQTKSIFLDATFVLVRWRQYVIFLTKTDLVLKLVMVLSFNDS
jgi:uncharacterized protein YlxP (DUF503 family)